VSSSPFASERSALFSFECSAPFAFDRSDHRTAPGGIDPIDTHARPMKIAINQLEEYNHLASDGARQAARALSQMIGVRMRHEVTGVTSPDAATSACRSASPAVSPGRPC
jgi:hypothetical protein